MNRPARLLCLALCLSTLAAPAATAQTAPAAQPKSPAAKKPSAEAADPMAEVRRASAVSLVSALADEARNFGEPGLRARVQARAADALWETDKERARALFRRAWEAAEAADRDGANLSEAERERRRIAQGAAGARGLLNMRREVVTLAARRDRELGEEFLSKLDEARKEEAEAPATGGTQPAPAQTNEQRINPDNPPAAMMQRLNLAQQLLDDGDAERAMQFADPVLYPVNTFGMHFLNSLREKNKAAADERFAALARRAAIDPLSDANYVSLLSSYVFTPFLYITVRPDGNSHTRQFRGNTTPPGDLDPRLREAFIAAALQVLLRPVPPAEEDRTTSGRAGAYVVATRMLPLFERYAPDRAAALRARQTMLAQDTPERTRRPDNELLTEGIVPKDPSRDRVQDALDRLERAKSPNERDHIYFSAAMAALNSDASDVERARELANKIEDPDTRKQVLSFIAFRLVQEAVLAKKADDALRHSRGDELTRVQRVWGLTEAARLLAKEQPGRAVEALDEAAAEARRLDDGSAERVRALLAVATRLAELDRPRAWEAMHEVVKAANDLPGFSGEGGDITVRVQFKGGGAMTQNNNVESFDLSGVFAALARDDFDRAAALARTLKAESPRSVATLAVARTVLAKKTERATAAAAN